ncbi:MAG: metallophosphoesterase, partial [Phycisphaerae bacterium]|nr:metallophosphoesterase [Phycisphaerae bacterium]
LISDIHSNIEALQAVFDDIARRSIRRVICLGDVVGYGPNPCECLDLIIERCEACICGNHDQAVFYEPYSFNIGAERAALWTRQVLESEPNNALRNRRWDFLGKLPVKHRGDGFVCVHGSPRKPINEYLFPDDVYSNPNKLLDNFRRLDEPTCFVGHTHVPGVLLDDPYFDPPDELAEPNQFELGEQAIVNVGSVGQPRDRDWRASYVVMNEETVEFVRVEYDLEKTAAKIKKVPEIDDFLGERLKEGR